MRLAGIGSFLGAVAIGAVAYAELLANGRGGRSLLTLVIGDWFPTLFDVAMIAIAAGITAMVTAAMLDPSRVEPRGRRLRIAFGTTLVALVAASLVPTAVISGFQFLNRPGFVALPAESEGGCRIVASEWSFLLGGGGTVGIVQPGSVTVDWIRDFTADDGQVPFARGAYTLRWDDRTADLVLRGTPGDPVSWTSSGSFTCAR